MSSLERQLAEDRVLRDAALAEFKADLAFIRTDLREKGVLAVVLWFARGPILDATGRLLGVDEEDGEEEEPAVADDRSGKKRARKERPRT